MTSCLTCPIGKYCLDPTNPVSCDAGTYAAGGAIICTNCPAGIYFYRIFF